MDDEVAELRAENWRLKEKNRELNRRSQEADAAAADAKRCLDVLAAGTEKGTPWCSGSMGRALLAWHVGRLETAAQAVVDDYLRLHPRFDSGNGGDHGVVIRELRSVLNKRGSPASNGREGMMRSSEKTRAEVIEYAAELLVESWDRGKLVPDDVEALRAAIALKPEPASFNFVVEAIGTKWNLRNGKQATFEAYTRHEKFPVFLKVEPGEYVYANMSGVASKGAEWDVVSKVR